MLWYHAPGLLAVIRRIAYESDFCFNVGPIAFVDALTVYGLFEREWEELAVGVDVNYFFLPRQVLTAVTSNGMMKTIKNEKHHAVSTDKVTIGCCL